MKVVGKLPLVLYRKIQAATPVLCVDLVVVDQKRKTFLLVKRANSPLKGKWFLPGGRVYKNEKLKEAALRKLREETGLRGRVVRELGVWEYISEKSGYFRGVNLHSVSAVYLVEIVGGKKVILDNQSFGAEWFNEINPGWHFYAKKFLRLAGFK